MAAEVVVPPLGESVTEATVGTWNKEAGDVVAADEIICDLETDKVTLEVRAHVSGVLAEIAAPSGTTVGVGALLAQIAEGEAPISAAKPAAAPAPAKPAREGQPPPAGGKPRDVEDAPSAKKLMAEHGLKPDQVTGSGRGQRVLKEDVLKALKAAEQAAAAETPGAGPSRPAPEPDLEERVRMSRLRLTIARRLKEAQNTAAMLTTYNEADMSGVMQLRADYKDEFEKKHGVRLGFMGFFVKACCSALIEVPEVNAEIDGDEIVYKRYAHVGVAVGTPNGLVVPVLRHAERMSLDEIERTIAELAARAREGRLALADMQGGTFSISNGGVYGSLMSSPILNPPQSGILGMHKIQQRPIAVDGAVVIRPMMYLALSYDHRIVDGKGAVSFLVRVKELIEDPRRLLMGI